MNIGPTLAPTIFSIPFVFATDPYACAPLQTSLIWRVVTLLFAC